MSGPSHGDAEGGQGGGLRAAAVVVVVGVGFAALALLAPALHAGPLPVAVTVPPQAWLVRQLAGNRAAVEVLLPPGSSPHTYEPTPQQVARLGGARLVVAVGHPALPFEGRLLAALLPRQTPPRVVDMSEVAAGLSTASLADAVAGDPHLWLSPAVMRATATAVAAALSDLDPAGSDLYRQHLASVVAAIDRVDADLRRELTGLPRRRFLVYHPAWGYLAREYGLEQAAVEAEGKEPSPRQLVALVERERRDGTRVLFVQRGDSEAPARALAAELGARLVTLDPLAADWPDNLRRVGAALREALGG